MKLVDVLRVDAVLKFHHQELATGMDLELELELAELALKVLASDQVLAPPEQSFLARVPVQVRELAEAVVQAAAQGWVKHPAQE